MTIIILILQKNKKTKNGQSNKASFILYNTEWYFSHKSFKKDNFP